LAAPVLALSFAPPAWLRRLWQARDQLDWNRATEDLLKFSSETEDIAARGVAWAVRALGGEAGFIADVDGSVLSSVGIPAGESRQMLEHLVGSPLPRIVGLPGDRGDHIVAVPVDSRLGVGTLAVVSGPFTPVFGTHEVASLEQYARPVSLALDRVRLVQALEQQTVRYESLLKAASDLGEGVLLTDAGRLLFANQAYVDLTGYTFEELASMPSLLELAVPEEREAIAGYLRSRLDGRIAPDRYESAFVHKDGHRVDVEVSVKLLPGKGQRQIVSLVRDITDRKRAEATLRDAYERQRQAVEELRRADEMKNAFLSAVSHELRTPLTSVLGYALTLEHQYDGLQPRERLDFLSRLAHNARKLDRLLADLLDLGRLTRGVLLLDRHRVDVGALVRRVLREADTGGHPLSAQIEAAEAEVDPPKVERIVENLVANAAKHTPAGTGIVVRVKGEGSNVLVTVEDEGPGIPPELRASIFEPFERGPGAPAHAPGTGIGLTLVARFAELHGGRTWVSDRVGGGASFKVLLPRYQGRPADGDDRSDPDAGSPERTDQSEERQPAGSGGPVGAGAG
ncbi:MAG TPA: PAS domain-containing sensor histidine kinase, partial [Actinomycetota bacterium]